MCLCVCVWGGGGGVINHRSFNIVKIKLCTVFISDNLPILGLYVARRIF